MGKKTVPHKWGLWETPPLVNQELIMEVENGEDGDSSHEIKRCLFLGRKAMINLHSILKSRDFPFPAKVHLVKVRIFPVVTYGCESLTIKKVLHCKSCTSSLRSHFGICESAAFIILEIQSKLREKEKAGGGRCPIFNILLHIIYKLAQR